MPRVLVVSHTGRATGFGTVAAGIAAALSLDHELHVVGLGGAAADEPWTGHRHDGRLDPTRTFAASRAAGSVRPAVAILAGKGDVLAWMSTQLRRDGFAGTIVAYVPIEGPVLDPAPLARLEHATALVAYTHAGAAMLAEAMAANAAGGAAPEVAVIPHGVDGVRPTARDPVERMRAELLPDAAGSVGGTWVLNANRNDWRKRPELTLRAFVPVAERHPDARLVLHCAVRRRDVDLRVERARLGLGDRVILTRERDDQPWPASRLSRLYASCEIGVSTATAEAWGLVAFEHALHGAAQVLPAHAGLRETWGEAPAWTPLGRRARVDNVFDGAEPAADALASILLDLVGRPECARAVGAACARRARDPALSWRDVGDRWLGLVARVLDGGPPPAGQRTNRQS